MSVWKERWIGEEKEVGYGAHYSRKKRERKGMDEDRWMEEK